jgi:hypothetical protein
LEIAIAILLAYRFIGEDFRWALVFTGLSSNHLMLPRFEMPSSSKSEKITTPAQALVHRRHVAGTGAIYGGKSARTRTAGPRRPARDLSLRSAAPLSGGVEVHPVAADLTLTGAITTDGNLKALTLSDFLDWDFDGLLCVPFRRLPVSKTRARPNVQLDASLKLAAPANN